MFKFGIFEPETKIKDPMGSVIVNTNATGAPNFEWLYLSEFGGYGNPKTEVGNILPYSDSVSYKIKLLNQIPKYENINLTTTTTTTSSTTTTTSLAVSPNSNNLFYLASDECYSTNAITYTNSCLNGPFRIGSKLYYIDFRVLYLVNLGDQPLYSPLFSVDTRKCTSEYGVFIAAPKVNQNFVVDANKVNNRKSMFDFLPKYSNQVDLFNPAMEYKFTVLRSGSVQPNEEITEFGAITKQKLSNLIQQVGGLNDIPSSSLGQTSIIADNASNEPLILTADKDTSIQLGTSGSTLNPGGFYPFILFRYISATAKTAPVEIAFTVAPSIA